MITLDKVKLVAALDCLLDFDPAQFSVVKHWPPFFWQLWHSLQAMLFSFLAFVAFGTGEGLLWYGICVPCSKRPPGVRDAFSEAFGVKNRLLRYGRDIRCAEQPSVVRDASGYSVSAPPLSLVRNRSLGAKKGHHRNNTKKGQILRLVPFSSGGWTRTNDLRVMSPTSYHLLYPAMFEDTKVGISFEFTKFFSLLLQILRSAARFLPVTRLFSAAEELRH